MASLEAKFYAFCQLIAVFKLYKEHGDAHISRRDARLLHITRGVGGFRIARTIYHCNMHVNTGTKVYLLVERLTYPGLLTAHDEVGVMLGHVALLPKNETYQISISLS